MRINGRDINNMINKIKKAIILLLRGEFSTALHKAVTAFQEISERHRIPWLPMNLMIEPTNVCNMNCPTCPTGNKTMNRAPRMMTYDEFKGIVNQGKRYVTHITLWNYGEPFLNKQLLDMIRYAVSAGISVCTSTNGQFFESKEFCSKVVKSGLHHLIICLDGADQETIEKFRDGAHFDSIVNGIKNILLARRENGAANPYIELQFIVMRHNENQKCRMERFAHELGVDGYAEKTVGIDANDPLFQEKCRQLLPEDLSASRYYRKNDGTYHLKRANMNYCSWMHASTVINSDGTVVPCCYDLYSRHIMGNVFKEPLSIIWKGERYRSFRKQIRHNRARIKICAICSEGVPVSNHKTIRELGRDRNSR